MIECIFTSINNGYLPKAVTLHDIARDFGHDVTVEQAEDALRMVQRLDPPGVGARDLRECLLLQLTPETPCHDTLRVLISHHLDDLQHNRLPAIEKKTGLSIEAIKEAIEHLRRLNPRPGSSYNLQENTQYVVPDLIVEPNDQGEYEVRLVDDHTPQLAISNYYQQQLKNKSTDPAAREFIQKRIQSAGACATPPRNAGAAPSRASAPVTTPVSSEPSWLEISGRRDNQRALPTEYAVQESNAPNAQASPARRVPSA